MRTLSRPARSAGFLPHTHTHIIYIVIAASVISVFKVLPYDACWKNLPSAFVFWTVKAFPCIQCSEARTAKTSSELGQRQKTLCVCVCVCACVRACMRACVRACVLWRSKCKLCAWSDFGCLLLLLLLKCTPNFLQYLNMWEFNDLPFFRYWKLWKLNSVKSASDRITYLRCLHLNSVRLMCNKLRTVTILIWNLTTLGQKYTPVYFGNQLYLNGYQPEGQLRIFRQFLACGTLYQYTGCFIPFYVLFIGFRCSVSKPIPLSLLLACFVESQVYERLDCVEGKV